MKKLIFAIIICFACTVYAQPYDYPEYPNNQIMSEYLSANTDNDNKSIIYVFFSNQPCYTCPEAIAMVEEIYNHEYINEYDLFLINYQDDTSNNFISKYDLSYPLEVVLVRVNDGSAFGYRKLDYLQDMTTDPISFRDYFTNAVNSFLGNNE